MKERLAAWLLFAIVVVILGIATTMTVAGSIALIGFYVIETVMMWRHKKQYPHP
jgi:hypothetical protein